MKLLIVVDAFPPMRTSAAVHMHDLALELIRNDHQVAVITPTSSKNVSFSEKIFDGCKLIEISTLKTKDISYIRRSIAEFLSPLIMYRKLRLTSIAGESFDGIIWYSPSIFFGPLISLLKIKYKCPAYLVLRDMFPDWMLDLGLIKQGLSYYLLKLFEAYQYKVADHIGIQAPGNFKYFNVGFFKNFKPKVQLLWTWVTPAGPPESCSINLTNTEFDGRINFVYAGNMGVAQDFDLVMSLASLYKGRSDIGFVFVGRGSEVNRLKKIALSYDLKNVHFFDEIESREIPALYAQCSIGLVALDLRHKSNNIPGKFLSYMQSGLPVLARLNYGNDLVQLIEDYQVGASYVGSSDREFMNVANQLIESLASDKNFPVRCKHLANTLFSTENAASQIIGALTSGNHENPLPPR